MCKYGIILIVKHVNCCLSQIAKFFSCEKDKTLQIQTYICNPNANANPKANANANLMQDL